MNALIEPAIWMIRVDGYDEDAGEDYIRTASEYGYFTAEAMAQAKADALNAEAKAGWEAELAQRDEVDAAALAEFRQQLEDTKALRASSARRIPDPAKPYPVRRPTFPEWAIASGYPVYSAEPVGMGEL